MLRLAGGVRAIALTVEVHYRSREKLAELAVTRLSPTLVGTTVTALPSPERLRTSPAIVLSTAGSAGRQGTSTANEMSTTCQA